MHCRQWGGALPPYLQEAADLLGQFQQAVLALVHGPGDGHRQPLADGLGVPLVEQVCGGAALALQVVQRGLGQQDGAGRDGAICRAKSATALLEPAVTVVSKFTKNSPTKMGEL